MNWDELMNLPIDELKKMLKEEIEESQEKMIYDLPDIEKRLELSN